MNNDAIIYEQPLNELVRVCLRLEQLFLQVDYYSKDTSILGSRNVIVNIISLLNLLDRPDLKAKLAKELSHQVTILSKLENVPHIDGAKLKQLLTQLDELAHWFIESSSKIGQKLRDIELLNNLRLHLASPGGGCSFDIPVYHYWLQQPNEIRQRTLSTWLEEFSQVRLAVVLLLQLIRESSKPQSKMAEKGYYQEMLDPQTNLRLIRVAIPKDAPTFPEISISRHFVSVRFFTPTIGARPTQFPENLSFLLSYCTS